jgi:uncharacterized membrane protein YsdA (DUF1294 family)
MPDLLTLIVIGYFVIINLVAFTATWVDKRRAGAGKWRIKERTLFTYALLGGIWGLLLGMRRFRHKTRKLSFRIIATLILILNIGYYVLAWWLLG